MAAVDAEHALAARVYCSGAERPFGELTVEQVEARAAELRGAAGFGHRSRVAPVAAAWGALAAQMRDRGAARVDELDPATISARAEALWVLPPGGSLLP